MLECQLDTASHGTGDPALLHLLPAHAQGMLVNAHYQESLVSCLIFCLFFHLFFF